MGQKLDLCLTCNSIEEFLSCRDKRKYDYSQVQRWTLPKKLKLTAQSSSSILDCDRIIAPVHLGCHWTCAMADLEKKEFVYLDSMLVRNLSYSIWLPKRRIVWAQNLEIAQAVRICNLRMEVIYMNPQSWAQMS